MFSRGDLVVLTYPNTSEEVLATGRGRWVGLILDPDYEGKVRVKLYLAFVRGGHSIEKQPAEHLVKIGSLDDLGVVLPDEYQDESWR